MGKLIVKELAQLTQLIQTDADWRLALFCVLTFTACLAAGGFGYH